MNGSNHLLNGAPYRAMALALSGIVGVLLIGGALYLTHRAAGKEH